MGLSPGYRLGPYRIVNLIGAGGMGEVYRAEDTRLNRTVAVKVLNAGLAADSGARERFEREARAVSSLNHPHVCVLYDVGWQAGLSFFVMEYLEGESLAARLRNGPLPLDATLHYAVQIADALEAAHSQGIVHRDIKPANIMITSRDEVKILDFGLAKISAGSTGEVALTMPGSIMGTVAYMSPEQASGEALDARTDLFSFGSVLYEMTTGKMAFPGDTMVALTAILNSPPRDPTTLISGIPVELRRVIDRLLAKDREARYQNAGLVLADLRSIQRSIWSRPTIEAVASTAKAARRKIAGFAAVAVVAAGAVTGGYLQRRPAPILTERDSIVLADFANTTGETVFDGTLRQALLLKLAESPFLKLLPDDQMTRTLRMMMRPPGEPVTPEVAREVCQRNGLKAVVSGAVSRVGNHYFLQLTATNCSNGESLASSGVEVKNKDTMLRALSNSAVELRSKLGESLQSVRKYDKPFEATSSSLEALRAYTLARKSRQEGNLTDQVAWLERAVALDPKFAYGYAALSAEYWNRRQADKAADYGLKAFELRDQVTERERFNLLDKYYGNVTGQLEEQLQSDKLWTGEYPRDYVAFANLGTAYGIAGQLDKGLEATLEALRLDPGAVTPYGNAMGYYAALGRFDEAKNVYEDARRHNIAYRHIPVFYYDVAFMRHDAAGMAEAVQEAMGKDGAQDEILVEIALADAYAGKLQRAGESLARAVAVAQRKDNKHSMAISYATRAHVEALFGANQEARRDAIKALELAPERDLLAVAGWSLARAGDTARAKAAEQELRSRYRLNTIVNRVYLPALRAEIENANNRPDLAVEALKDTSVYELGTSGGTRALYSLYVRGESYLRTRQGKAALAEFQKILDRPGVVMNAPLTPLARLGLARGYALDGDTARSRAEYLNFLTIWNEADAGLPIVVRARREYMALQ